MVQRIAALQQVKKEPDFEPLAIAFKRAVNILSGTESAAVNTKLFESPAETALHQKYASLVEPVQAFMNSREYLAALKLIATLRPEVDAFFDGVMVMVDNAALRNNRLALLHEISSLFENFADFTRLS
jgi:glycyl-tRNA synthetase beta chain